MADELEDNGLKEKEIEFHAASFNAWYNSSLEHDKSILTLSAGAIGLLVGLMNVASEISAAGLILNIASIICFIISLFSILYIFKYNKNHIIEMLKEGAQHSSLLKTLDTIAILSFGLGVLLASILAISIAVQTYVQKEIVMANENKGRPGFAQDSFNAVSSLKPQGHLEKSFSGAGLLNPPAKPSQTPQPAAQATPPATPPADK